MDNENTGAVTEGNLRFLKVLVTVLTATMIGGLIAIFAVIVIRFPKAGSGLALPDRITLPDGVEAEAVTFGKDWIAVVSGDEILILDRVSGELRQHVAIGR